MPSICTTSTEVQCGLVAIPSIQENIRDNNHSLDLSVHYILIPVQMLHHADVCECEGRRTTPLLTTFRNLWLYGSVQFLST